jgi:hypothetical protein
MENKQLFNRKNLKQNRILFEKEFYFCRSFFMESSEIRKSYLRFGNRFVFQEPDYVLNEIMKVFKVKD